MNIEKVYDVERVGLGTSHHTIKQDFEEALRAHSQSQRGERMILGVYVLDEDSPGEFSYSVLRYSIADTEDWHELDQNLQIALAEHHHEQNRTDS